MDRTEYFARPQATRALGELTDACFEARERTGDESGFPDAAEFLRERGIDPPGGGKISVRHTIEEPGTAVEDLMTPDRPICPGGHDGCRPTDCRLVKGQWVCSWTCNCPESL